jgi:hypothetical protein
MSDFCEEVWKPLNVTLYNTKYEVSNLGYVRRVRDKWSVKKHGHDAYKILRQTKQHGYCYVTLSVHGRLKRFQVHVLVAGAFIGLRPIDKVTSHKDNNPGNNRLENLEYVSQSENLHNSKKWTPNGLWERVSEPRIVFLDKL